VRLQMPCIHKYMYIMMGNVRMYMYIPINAQITHPCGAATIKAYDE